MARVKCSNCKNEKGNSDCQYGFRMAANAGGRGVDCRQDVWFCQDYEEKTEDYINE